MEEDIFTQFGYACNQLGIEIKTSSIPQAKGRVERLNQTLQSRPPIDLQRNKITTIEEANHYLKRWIKPFNRKFGNKTSLSVFEVAPKPAQRNLILARVTERVVDSGHHIRSQNNFYLPIEGQNEVFFSRKTKALVIQAFDGEIYVNIADKIYPTRKLLAHELYSNEFENAHENKKRKTQGYSPTISPVETRIFQKISS